MLFIMWHQCSKCEEIKSYYFFGLHPTGFLGLQSRCKKCMSEYSSEYYKKEENKERQKENRQNSRNIPEKFDIYVFNKMVEFYLNRCLCCGKEFIEGHPYRQLTIDHIFPIGDTACTNHFSNIQPLCKSCNSSKGRKIIDYRSEESMMEFLDFLEFCVYIQIQDK